jgi:NDP-sugar pyrophosphorylase family protein
MIQQAVILAAGRGTRLQSLSKDVSKVMLPILGKPIMVRVMDRCLEAGIKRFVVVIGEQEGGLASYLSHSWYPHTEVKYVLQLTPNGTADALALAAKQIEGDFLIAAADTIPLPDHIPALLKKFNETDADMVLSVTPAAPTEIKTSAEATIEGDWVKKIVEKPEEPVGDQLAFMLYAAKKEFLTYLPKVTFSKRGEKEIVSAIQALIDAGGKVGYQSATQRYHFSKDADLYKISRAYLDEGRDAHILSELPGSVTIIPPIRIDPGVVVGQKAKIGPYVYLESGSAVGEGAMVTESLILRNSVIPKGETCKRQIVSRTNRISI